MKVSLSSVDKLPVRLYTLVFLLSFALRVVWVLVAPAIDPIFANPLHVDAGSYDAIARSVASGGGFQLRDAPTAFRAPGYPFFLAFVYALFGRSILLVQVIQVLMGAVTATLISYLGWQIGGRSVGFLAGIGAAVYPQFIYFTYPLLSETLFLLLWIIGLMMLISLLQKRQFRIVVLAAVPLGLATLVRSVALFAVFLWGFLLFLLAIKRRKQEYARLGLAFIGISILILLPWAVRNYVVFDAFIPISTNGGYVVYTGNNLSTAKWQTGLGEPGRDREYYRQALDWIQTNPDDFFKLLPTKLYQLWSPLSVAGKPLKTDFASLIYLSWVIFLTLSAIGLILMARHKVDSALVLAIPLIATNISSLIFYGCTRFALPMAPSLILFTALALNRMVLRVHRGMVLSSENRAV